MTVSETQRLSFFQSAFLGDLLLTLPSLYQYKAAFPQTKLDYICLKKWAPLIECYPFIDRVVAIEKADYRNPLKWRHLKERIGKPTVFVSGHRSLSSQIFNLANIPKETRKITFRTTPASFFYKERIPYDRSKHELSRIADLFDPLHEQPVKSPLASEIPVFFPLEIENWFQTLGLEKRQFIVLCVGSHWKTKRWPFHSFLDLALRLEAAGHTVVWTGLSKEIEERLPLLKNNFIDQTNLKQWAYLITHAQAIICNDSAATHFGSLHRIPGVTLMGPTVADIGYGPLYPKSRVAQIELDCRPCHIHGPKECPKKHHACMNDLTPSHVYNLLETVLHPMT